MTSLESALHAIATELSRLNVDFALVGGLAVSVRTEPRFTRDADLAVAVQADAEAERLIHSLRSSGFLVQTVVEQESVGRLATVRLAFSPQGQTPVVDLLFASSGIETEIVAAAETLELLPSLKDASGCGGPPHCARRFNRGRVLHEDLARLEEPGARS